MTINKNYTTIGYALHKGLFLLLFFIWLVLLTGALFIRLSELWHAKQKLFSLMPFSSLAIFTAYIVYVIKITSLRIEIADKGLTYERAIRRGLRFMRRSFFVSWPSIKSVSRHDGQNGALYIHSEQGEFIYWNMLLPQENDELVNEIQRRIVTQGGSGFQHKRPKRPGSDQGK